MKKSNGFKTYGMLMILSVIVITLVVCMILLPDRFSLQDACSVGAFLISILAFAQSFVAQKESREAQEMANAREDDLNRKEFSCDILIENHAADSSFIHKNNLKSYKTAPARCLNGKEKCKNANLSCYGSYPLCIETNNRISINFSNLCDILLNSYTIVFSRKDGSFEVFSHDLTLVKDQKKNGNIILPMDFNTNDYSNVCYIVFNSCYDEKTYGAFKIMPPASEISANGELNPHIRKKYVVTGYTPYGTSIPERIRKTIPKEVETALSI